MKKLPIGIQTFSKLREQGCVYVDKTNFALRLIQEGEYYFLSRPRRFGKSLFLDTLAEIFLGNKKLFKGLYIYDKYDFKPHPVIKISFGSGDYITEEIIFNEIDRIFERNEKELKVTSLHKKDIRGRFEELIVKVSEKYKNKVVILIDEYDKPILDNILNKELAIKARSILKNLYGVIKDSDRYIKFVFITGVSKFSKLNLFSGLNNLRDITVIKEYGEICGYTHNDLENVFFEHLKNVNLEKVKKWYNGYNYFGEKIYNPYDILLFIANGYEFRNYWWSTGNPSFLIDKLKETNYYLPKLDNALISEEGLDIFDVEYIDILALLWQTGYLTFKDKIIDKFGRITYRLCIPNLEIQFSLHELFIDYLTNQRYEKRLYEENLLIALDNRDFEKFKEILQSIFSSIPYENYVNNVLSRYEGYYSSVIYVYLKALGYDVVAEDTTNKGRIDITIKTDTMIVIIEFKVDSKEDAIEQILKKKYYEKYKSEGKEIYLVGIKFDSRERNIVELKSKKYNQE
ncbi:PD-(D/E)XK nuclease superfamily protein [Desulfonauticus submarinus]|uniref:PD-(D/E)XK nuclease superfamily protein n=1 Tax=Desulfonauticus submarinus TaxID=206665 RepID=A0A1H0DMD0_9BACT|nr:ATP-binding protein [Desulfonauticus submarinus]SDN71203.1 PD-(D/E)XK nuclease superfamily protein [Desulfonauticus submarinus]